MCTAASDDDEEEDEAIGSEKDDHDVSKSGIAGSSIAGLVLGTDTPVHASDATDGPCASACTIAKPTRRGRAPKSAGKETAPTGRKRRKQATEKETEEGSASKRQSGDGAKDSTAAGNSSELAQSQVADGQ